MLGYLPVASVTLRARHSKQSLQCFQRASLRMHAGVREAMRKRERCDVGDVGRASWVCDAR